ncbi:MULTISPECIES: sensor histidine kinase [Acidobacteriaceae]|uniref:sensor histidine kinase n=1 Tax=Acidobacteriaceae TaxID=204434 RepID=UPI00131DE0F2|nr:MULTISPECIES: sensor histidine kinase [Acidobacteriaceae]MDW5265041.1 sensor histidine kinase [Edaphobacter sp.]
MKHSASNSSSSRGKWAWIWFAYTSFLFISPILEPSRPLWLGTLTVFVVFLALFTRYFTVDLECRLTPLWAVVTTFGLGLITFPWNQGGSTFFIYAAIYLPFSILSIRRVLTLFASEVILIAVEGAIFHAQRGVFHISWFNTVFAIFLTAFIGGGNIFSAEQRRADRKLRSALDENLALAAVAERERIARDLHDVLGHTLSVIVLKAELAGRLIERAQPADQERAASEIADVEGIARTSLAEVREAISGYRTRGLTAEIEAARRTLQAAGVTVLMEFDATPVADLLSADEETALSLALREAVTNIVRHANATTCRLDFITDGGHRRLVIHDDGQNVIIREGNGLRGMRQRIESIGGQLLLDRDNGTRLLIELPLSNSTEYASSAAS